MECVSECVNVALVIWLIVYLWSSGSEAQRWVSLSEPVDWMWNIFLKLPHAFLRNHPAIRWRSWHYVRSTCHLFLWVGLVTLNVSVCCLWVSVWVCQLCVASVHPSMHPAPDTDRERERRASVNFLLEFIFFRPEKSMIVFTQEESEGEIRRTCTGAYKRCVFMAQKDKILNIDNKTHNTVLFIFLRRKILLLENVSCKQQSFMKNNKLIIIDMHLNKTVQSEQPSISWFLMFTLHCFTPQNKTGSTFL